MRLSTDEPCSMPNGHSLRQSLFVDVLRQFGTARLAVTGSSMLPTVWPGDILVVERQHSDQLQRGQVILCLRDGELVAHRMVRRSGELLVTRGDSLLHNDRPFQAENVVGQVISILRNGRRLSPEQSAWQRALSSILRHSDFCTRMVLRVGRRLQRLRSMELLWAS